MPDYTMRAPGVYIEEQAATGPIAGVSTSVAAFIGPTAQGPLGKAVLITNWTQFRTNFGDYLPGSYMAHAVRGFFDNGGTLVYIVRVGTGAAASFDLLSAGEVSQIALRVRARHEGKAGNEIQVAVEHTHIVSEAENAEVVRASAEIASAADKIVTLKNYADRILFEPGDTITIEGSNERAKIDFIYTGSSGKPDIYLLSDLAGSYSQGAVRIADLVTGQQSLRLKNFAGIEIGSVIRLSQNQLSEGETIEYHTITNKAGGLVTLEWEGVRFPYNLATDSTPVRVITEEFSLTVHPLNGSPRVFANLSMNRAHSRYFLTFVDSEFVELALPPEPDLLPVPGNEPVELQATNLHGGEDVTVSNLDPEDYKKALRLLEKVADISIICVPGCTVAAIQADVVANCEATNRFAILDSVYEAENPIDPEGPLNQQRGTVQSARGHAALYYPWIAVANPLGQPTTVPVPPSGHLAGVYARSDSQRGVHKAPANEMITGALGLQQVLDDGEQGVLNNWGIDVIRIFPGQARPTIWGARTTAPREELPWRFINVRRLFIFIEKSIQSGIRWAVFEPNSVTLWKQLARTITDFLTRVWGSGALAGRSTAEAFYVKIDEELNPPSLQAAGQVIVEIGIAPVRPAEFVIVRISMWDGSSSVSEE